MATADLITERAPALAESDRTEILGKLKWIQELIRKKLAWYPDPPKAFEKSLIPLSAFCPITNAEEQEMCTQLSTNIDQVIKLTEDINSSIELIRNAFVKLLNTIPIPAPPCGGHIRELLEWTPAFMQINGTPENEDCS